MNFQNIWLITKRLALGCALILCSGCVTLHTSLNYSVDQNRDKIGENTVVLLQDVDDFRGVESTVIGHFLLGGDTKGNVFHQPKDLFPKLQAILQNELTASGFAVEPGRAYEIEIIPSLSSLGCVQTGYQGATASMSMAIVVKDRGKLVIEHTYEASEVAKHFDAGGIPPTSHCNVAITRTTRTIMSEFISDMQEYMTS
ncbi:MAG: putative lipoprotein YajG [Candidatus Omnitrophota bacterium]|jgi:uncharacterized lipoprotein YajG